MDDESFEMARKVAKSLSRHLDIDVARKTKEIRKRKSEFPSDICSAIDSLKDEKDPKAFVGAIEDATLQMIEESIVDNWCGIPCTDAELEVAIRFFPNALWYPFEHNRISVGINENILHPDFLIPFVPFIPVFAKLGIESGGYAEEERGGLMAYRDRYGRYDSYGRYDTNLLHLICTATAGDRKRFPSEEEYRLKSLYADKVCLAAMQRLKDLGIFVKDDVYRHNLIGSITRRRHEDTHEQRLRYLVDWCPEALLEKINDLDGIGESEEMESAHEPANKKLRCK